MRVLGIDSAGAGASAALLGDDAVLTSRAAARAHGQAEILMPMIAAVLAESGLAATALDLIAVTVGPGSFTGLRVAIAAARGLALATGVPAIGISSFRVIAAQVPASRRRGLPLVVALETRRQDFYLECFAADVEAAGAPILADRDQAAAWLPPGPLLVAGDAAARLAAALPARGVEVVDGTTQAWASDVARLGAAEVVAGTVPAPPRPVYLRAPDVTEPRRKSAR